MILRFLPFHRSEYIFLLMVAAYVGICGAVAHFYGQGDRFHPLMYMERCVVMTTFLGLVYFFYLCLRIIYIMTAIRPRKLIRFIWDDWRAGPLNFERHIRALPIFIGFVFFFSAFTSMKQMIPGINPFSWDAEFAALDHWLHFGIDPWRILHPVFSPPPMTYLLNLNYNIWLVTVFAALYWQLFSLANPRVRMQFFYAFFLCWIINGTLLAIIFSSAGPCFLERLTGNTYYNELMGHLNHAHQYFRIFAVSTQDMVWNAASKGQSMMGGGISAMPSIHVTSALLFWLLAIALKNKYERGFCLFFVFILLGSVYLAWHYAVDGYLAIITTFALWRISGWLIDKVGTPEKSQ